MIAIDAISSLEERARSGNLLRARGLRKSYPTPAEPLVVLDGVDLSAESGESVAIMGPSGSGKSTLLHLLGALDEPDSGDVTVAGENPFAGDAASRARFRSRRVGFVFQDHHLLPQCSALENVLVPTVVADAGGESTEVAAKRFEARARDLLARVGLGGRVDHRPSELSGGERQRVAIARALIAGPAMLLCDEPTGNLDRRSAAMAGELFARIRAEEGVAMIVVTHSPELAALSDRRYELVEGRLVEA